MSRNYQDYTPCNRVERRNAPIGQRPSHPEQRFRGGLCDHIDKQLEAGVLEPTQTKWVSSILLVSKNDVILQYCVDYWHLNTVTIPDAYPLPQMDDCIASLGEAQVFIALDALWGE